MASTVHNSGWVASAKASNKTTSYSCSCKGSLKQPGFNANGMKPFIRPSPSFMQGLPNLSRDARQLIVPEWLNVLPIQRKRLKTMNLHSARMLVRPDPRVQHIQSCAHANLQHFDRTRWSALKRCLQPAFAKNMLRFIPGPIDAVIKHVLVKAIAGCCCRLWSKSPSHVKGRRFKSKAFYGAKAKQSKIQSNRVNRIDHSQRGG